MQSIFEKLVKEHDIHSQLSILLSLQESGLQFTIPSSCFSAIFPQHRLRGHCKWRNCRGAISNYHFTLVAFLYNTDLFYRYRQPSTMVFYVSLHVTVRLTGECKPRGVRIPDNVTFLASRPMYIYVRATCSIIRIRLKTSKATIVEFYSPTTIKIETISRWANGLATSVTAVNISVSLNMMCARCTVN